MIYTFNGYSQTAYQMKKLLGVERWNKIIKEANKIKGWNNYHTMVTVNGNFFEVVVSW